MKSYKAGIVIRGRWIDDDLVEFGGRSVGITFTSPDPAAYVSEMPLGSPRKLTDLYAISFAEIVDFIDALGQRLRLSDNEYLQQAFEASCTTSPLTAPVLQAMYESMPQLFCRSTAIEIADVCIGIPYLEGWVPRVMDDGRTVSVRAFGARSVHIIAGNSPFVAAITILRNAITRGDAIIKSPSNDPFTALAIARTMIDMAPDHPITKHLSVAYWKGGDEAIEKKLYQPRHVEKIVAWGGFASVKHVTKYIQPGLELISLDPKRSSSIIGGEALIDDATMRDVARRLATDIGACNQEACVSARVIYVLSGTDPAGLENIKTLGRYTYEALLALPSSITTAARHMDPELRSSVTATRMSDEWYCVFGGLADEGAVIVSLLPEPVDFAAYLTNRVANLVPIDAIDEAFATVDAYTQTIGVYPESLKHAIRDRLGLYGAQRFTSLGYAAAAAYAAPQDGFDVNRELCKWIVCEDCDPATTPPLWDGGELVRTKAAA